MTSHLLCKQSVEDGELQKLLNPYWKWNKGLVRLRERQMEAIGPVIPLAMKQASFNEPVMPQALSNVIGSYSM